MDETTLLERSRRFVEEVWNAGDLSVVDELMARSLVDHALAPDSEQTGPEGVKAFIASIRAGMPDLHSAVQHEAARGDVTMQHLLVTGTHTGNLFGLPGAGGRIAFELADVNRFDGEGRVVEHWSVLDTASLMRQLGAEEFEPATDR